MTKQPDDPAGEEFNLYQNDLEMWSVTRFLRHCKVGRFAGHAQALWDALTEQEKEAVRVIARAERIGSTRT